MSATNVTYGMLIDGSNIYAPTLINNVVKPSSNPNAQVSCNMFKSASLYTSDGKAPFSAYIKGALEPVCGGHYYAKSFNNNTYQKCSCTIPLANCKMTKGYVNNVENKRVGYISIGIATEGGSLYHHFDVGLGNAGDGWYPMVWGQNFLANVTPNGPNIIHRDDADVPIAIALNDSKVIIPATATVSVLVEVGRTASVDWMRATFSYSGKTGKIAINVPRGTLFPNDSATNPTVRFNRFMSLPIILGLKAEWRTCKLALPTGQVAIFSTFGMFRTKMFLRSKFPLWQTPEAPLTRTMQLSIIPILFTKARCAGAQFKHSSSIGGA